MPAFTVDLTDEAQEDLAFYRAFDQKTIVDTIRAQLNSATRP